MKYVTEIQLAFGSLGSHKLRTFLTMLGMIFGVGAVIAMLSIGAGAERESLRLIDTMGLRNVIVRDRELNDEDLKRIRENSLGLSLRDVKAISAVTPDIDAYSARKRIKTYQIFSFQGKSDDSNVVGVTPSYFRLARYDLSEGSFFAESDNRDYEQYCVVGERARQKLFGYRSPLGQQIRVDDLWFTVIGVLEDRSLTKDEFEGVKLQDYSNDIYIPLETALKKFELKKFEPELDEIVIQMKNTEALRASAILISQILVNAHGHENDFSMIVPSELLDQNERTQRIFDVVMSCIAGISLLVGGIGIMNIMLANILERTREIGVRRAVGARRGDIRKQFLTEALAISLLGGLTGILFGFAVSRMVALYADWSTVVTWPAIAVSFGVATAVGLIFGIYPAARAARLNPVEALHYE